MLAPACLGAGFRVGTQKEEYFSQNLARRWIKRI